MANEEAKPPERWRPPARTDRHDALEELTQSVRRLIEATVATGEDAGVLRTAAAEVDGVVKRLEASRDDDPWRARSTGPGTTDASSLLGINPAIGRFNPIAPVVVVNLGEDGSLTGTVHFRLSHVGPPGRAHGGMIAAVFDQILGFSSVAVGFGGFTGSMTVKYRRATPLDTDVQFVARCAPSEGRTAHATAKFLDDDGVVLAEAEGMFVRPKEGL